MGNNFLFRNPWKFRWCVLIFYSYLLLLMKWYDFLSPPNWWNWLLVKGWIIIRVATRILNCSLALRRKCIFLKEREWRGHIVEEKDTFFVSTCMWLSERRQRSPLIPKNTFMRKRVSTFGIFEILDDEVLFLRILNTCYPRVYWCSYLPYEKSLTTNEYCFEGISHPLVRITICLHGNILKTPQ